MDAPNTARMEDEVLRTLQSRKEGLSNSDLTKMTGALTGRERSELINRILSSGDVEMLQVSGTNDFYLRYRTSSLPADASQEEQLIYSIVADKVGILMREIRDRSGLSETQLRKVLKSLEQKKLIKSLKAVGAKEKCYFLYDVDADPSLTGGTFYSDQQLDSQFVQTLITVCVAMLKARRSTSEENNLNDRRRQIEESFVSSDVVAKYLHDKAISKVELSVAEVESVLDIAVLDRKLEKRFGNQYRARNPPPFSSPLVTVPCSKCVMRTECRPGHRISPETCEYLKNVFDI